MIKKINGKQIASKMRRVKYTGTDSRLKGETALGFALEGEGVLIQANNRDLVIDGKMLGFGWHWFPFLDWKPENNKWFV
jgi:hypothetical protein